MKRIPIAVVMLLVLFTLSGWALDTATRVVSPVRSWSEADLDTLHQGWLYVKFVEGSDVLLRDGRFIDPGGLDLRAVNGLLANERAIEVRPTFKGDRARFRRLKAIGEAKAGVTGAGPGPIFGPHVRGWNSDGGAAAAIPAVSYFAYGTNRMGVNLTCGDVDGDGIDEIVTAPGPSALFGAHVRGWNCDGSTAAAIPGINFFAWDFPAVRYGARVSSGVDYNGDGRQEMLVGPGPDPAAPAVLKVFAYDGSSTTLLFSLGAFDETVTHGINAAGGSI